MRDSADFDDYGVTRRGRKRGKFDDDQPAFAKRGRHLPRLEAEDAGDATDGLPEGDRWSTWDQTETPVPNNIDSSHYGSGDDHMTCAGRRVVRDCCTSEVGSHKIVDTTRRTHGSSLFVTSWPDHRAAASQREGREVDVRQVGLEA